MAKGDDRLSERYHRKREAEQRYRKTLPSDDEPELPPPVETIKRKDGEIGRNDPCPCGSGKKYKKCCAAKDAAKPKKKGWFG